jgi:hypothetical protein
LRFGRHCGHHRRLLRWFQGRGTVC